MENDLSRYCELMVACVCCDTRGDLNFIWTKQHPWEQVRECRDPKREINRLQDQDQRPRLSAHSILCQNRDCLYKCWDNDPSSRPTITACKNEIERLYDGIEGESVEDARARITQYQFQRFAEDFRAAATGNLIVLRHEAGGSEPEPPTLLSHRYFSAVSPPNFAHFTPFFARSLRLGARKPDSTKERRKNGAKRAQNGRETVG